MRREPSLTFEGALRILGHHESRLIGKLDTALGGVILAAGAGIGLAAVGGPVLAPAAMFAAIWGLTDQKAEAVSLLGKAVGAVSGKLAGMRGYERRQLIAAAHTTIVIAAFFESFQENAGTAFSWLEIADTEKEALIATPRKDGERVCDILYAAEVPAPSPAYGFEENVVRVRDWFTTFGDELDDFLVGLSVAATARVEWEAVLGGAVERYRSHFLALAAKVPEFMIWALLGEGAATRAQVAGLRTDIAAALDAGRDALGRVELLLALDSSPGGAMLDLRAAVARANGGVLKQPIVPEDAQGYGPDITFPATGDIYISPRYRMVRAFAQRPADDSYWDDLPSRDDFDLMLAGYVTAPDATRQPLLLLGHPGAGKSLLTKIFAARLPTSAYTVVRVPLRRVGANAPVLDQIEQALGQATNRRVESWWRLADQSGGTVRVVLLDGLDELLQATRNDRTGYLQEVMEFQRTEADQDRPVVVVITSRTVVADRVNVPRDAAIVKLDDFEEPDIEEWLTRWRRANAAAIAAGRVRELTADCLTGGVATESQPGLTSGRLTGGVRELVRQPLLLLMLAIYAADPALPPLSADMATVDLYRRLLENFARREAVKDADHDLQPDELEDRVRDHLDRLEVAALAMFNRGRQDIGEEELGTDLAALDPDQRQAGRSRPAEAGQRVIGEFFFVHTAEARPLTGPDEPGADRGDRVLPRETPRRSYEFLHATFGEYLVASRVMNELAEVAARAFAGRRGPDPDDDLLYAVLSHQPLAARKSTLTFAREIFDGMLSDDPKLSLNVLEVLEVLLGGYRHRHNSGRYAGYRPLPPDQLRELACYSVNLVTLRVMLDPDENSIPLARLLRAPDDAPERWRSTVLLWKAALNADGLQSVLATLGLSDNPRGVGMKGVNAHLAVSRADDRRQTGAIEIDLARLIGDPAMEIRLRYGAAIADDYFYSVSGPGNWLHEMASWLIPAIAGKETPILVRSPPEGTSGRDLEIIADLIFSYLRVARGERDNDVAVLQLLFELPRVFRFDQKVLAAVTISDPTLLDSVPELRNPETYDRFAAYIEELSPESRQSPLSNEDIIRSREILAQLSEPRDPWDFNDAQRA